MEAALVSFSSASPAELTGWIRLLQALHGDESAAVLRRFVLRGIDRDYGLLWDACMDDRVLLRHANALFITVQPPPHVDSWAGDGSLDGGRPYVELCISDDDSSDDAMRTTVPCVHGASALLALPPMFFAAAARGRAPHLRVRVLQPRAPEEQAELATCELPLRTHALDEDHLVEVRSRGAAGELSSLQLHVDWVLHLASLRLTPMLKGMFKFSEALLAYKQKVESASEQLHAAGVPLRDLLGQMLMEHVLLDVLPILSAWPVDSIFCTSALPLWAHIAALAEALGADMPDYGVFIRFVPGWLARVRQKMVGRWLREALALEDWAAVRDRQASPSASVLAFISQLRSLAACDAVRTFIISHDRHAQQLAEAMAQALDAFAMEMEAGCEKLLRDDASHTLFVADASSPLDSSVGGPRLALYCQRLLSMQLCVATLRTLVTPPGEERLRCGEEAGAPLLSIAEDGVDRIADGIGAGMQPFLLGAMTALSGCPDEGPVVCPVPTCPLEQHISGFALCEHLHKAHKDEVLEVRLMCKLCDGMPLVQLSHFADKHSFAARVLSPTLLRYLRGCLGYFAAWFPDGTPAAAVMTLVRRHCWRHLLAGLRGMLRAQTGRTVLDRTTAQSMRQALLCAGGLRDVFIDVHGDEEATQLTQVVDILSLQCRSPTAMLKELMRLNATGWSTLPKRLCIAIADSAALYDPSAAELRSWLKTHRQSGAASAVHSDDDDSGDEKPASERSHGWLSWLHVRT